MHLLRLGLFGITVAVLSVTAASGSSDLDLATHSAVVPSRDGVTRWRSSEPSQPPRAQTLLPDGRDQFDLEQVATWESAGDCFVGGTLCLFDLNGDLQLDLAYSNYEFHTYVYQAAGNDSFPLVYDPPNPTNPDGMGTALLCTGDADRDGLPEMIYGSGTSGVPRNLFVVESSRRGVYPDSIVAIIPEVDISVNSLQIADLDRDGFRELVGSTQGTSERDIKIWENRGDNTYVPVYSQEFSWLASGETAVGDFDNDGRRDLVFPAHDTVHLLECDSNDQYSEVWSQYIGPVNMYWATNGADLDRDGRGDFLILQGDGLGWATWTTIMFESVGDNTYEEVWSYVFDSGWIDGGTTTGDMNGDGRRELLVQGGTTTLLFECTGDNDFQLVWRCDEDVEGQSGHRLITPDLDQDGKNEAIWFTQARPGIVVVYENAILPAFVGDWEVPREQPTLTVGPNPPGAEARLFYGLPRSGWFSLDLYDVSGRAIRRIGRGVSGPGVFSSRVGGLAPGVYFCQLRFGKDSVVRRVVLAR